MSGVIDARVAGSIGLSNNDERLIGMHWALSGMSSRNLSTWQSFDVQQAVGVRLQASGTA